MKNGLCEIMKNGNYKNNNNYEKIYPHLYSGTERSKC